MRRYVLLALVLPLCAPAAASARDGRCPERRGYEVVERSGDVVVTRRERPARGGPETAVYRACHRRIGRDPILDRTFDDLYLESTDLHRLLFRGRYVAMFKLYAERYQTNRVYVSLVDVVRGRVLASAVPTTVERYPHHHVHEAALGDHGDVAWIEGGYTGPLTLKALRFGHVVAVTPVKADLRGLSLEGDVLRWTADGVAREHRLPPTGYGPRARPRRCRLRRDTQLWAFNEDVVVWTPLNGTVRACLWTVRRPVALGGRRLERAAVAGELAAVVERTPDRARHVTVADVRARRVLATTTIRSDGAVVGAALGPRGHVAVLLADGTTFRVVLVADGQARTVGEWPGVMTFFGLRVDEGAVAWVRDGVPESIALP